MPQKISERQQTILALVVHDYTDSAQPVGSKRLVKMYSLGLSPATIRNEMASLTDAGYLRQPHTSAGRVPTEEGYRYFVGQLLGETDLPIDEQHTISHQFHQAGGDVNEWLRLAAAVLASQSHGASLVTAPHPDEAIFKHLELILTHGQQVLLVLVLEGGEVIQQLITVQEEIDQARLSEIANRMTSECLGKDAKDLSLMAEGRDDFQKEVLLLIGQLLDRSNQIQAGKIYRDGIANVLAQPEFSDSEQAQSALRLFEERSFLEEIMGSALSPDIGSIQVIIGGEGAWDELKHCSIILSRYGAEGYASGALGVLGPTRMAYGRTISSVRFVSTLMTNLISDAFPVQGSVDFDRE